jgi:hypothetical protein
VYEMAIRVLVALVTTSPADALDVLGKQFTGLREEVPVDNPAGHRLKAGEAFTRVIRRSGLTAFAFLTHFFAPGVFSKTLTT